MRDNTINYYKYDFICRSIEKYGEDSWDYSLLPEFLNSNIEYEFICKVCKKIIRETPTNHLRRHRRTKDFPGCQSCHLMEFNEARRKANELNFVKKAEEVFGVGTFCYENLNYKSQRENVTITKPNGETFIVRAESFLRGKTDDNKRSILEKNVNTWLTRNNIIFKEQLKISEIKTTAVKFIRVDFYLTLDNIHYIIETNGRQHYSLESMEHIMNKSRYRDRAIDRYQSQIQRDKDLRKYCEHEGIILIEIPYTYDTYSKIDDILYKTLINKKSPKEVINYPK